jgi:hypothetical protein
MYFSNGLVMFWWRYLATTDNSSPKIHAGELAALKRSLFRSPFNYYKGGSIQ